MLRTDPRTHGRYYLRMTRNKRCQLPPLAETDFHHGAFRDTFRATSFGDAFEHPRDKPIGARLCTDPNTHGRYHPRMTRNKGCQLLPLTKTDFHHDTFRDVSRATSFGDTFEHPETSP